MRTWKWSAAVAVPLLVAGGLALAASQGQTEKPQAGATSATPVVCPLTGEELPCPNCCPLNK